MSGGPLRPEHRWQGRGRSRRSRALLGWRPAAGQGETQELGFSTVAADGRRCACVLLLAEEHARLIARDDLSDRLGAPARFLGVSAEGGRVVFAWAGMLGHVLKQQRAFLEAPERVP